MFKSIIPVLTRSVDRLRKRSCRSIDSPNPSISIAHVLKTTAIHRVLRMKSLPIPQKTYTLILMLEKRAMKGCEERAPFVAPLANYKKLSSELIRSRKCTV